MNELVSKPKYLYIQEHIREGDLQPLCKFQPTLRVKNAYKWGRIKNSLCFTSGMYCQHIYLQYPPKKHQVYDTIITLMGIFDQKTIKL